MAILIWRGDAQATAQVTKVTPADAEVGDEFTLTINRKAITVVCDEDRELTDPTDAELVANVVDALVAAIGQYDNDIAEFAEVSAAAVDADGDGLSDYLEITGPTDGRPFTVTGSTGNANTYSITVKTVVAGEADVNEIQRIALDGATSGTFTVTFQGQTTGAVAYNASAATLQTALEALSNISAGDVSVTGDAGGPWDVEFLQAYAGTDVALMTGDGASLDGGTSVDSEETTKGGTRNEIWQFDWLGSSNTSYSATIKLWKLGAPNAGYTFSVSRSDSVSSIQARIDALYGAGKYVVRSWSNQGTGTAGFQIEWVGDLAGQDVSSFQDPPITVVAVYTISGTQTTNDSVDVEEIQSGTAGNNEVQTITISGGPTGGTFTLTYDAQTTAGIAYNASAATVQTALEGLSNIGVGDVAVTGSAGGPYTVTFGGALAGTDVSLITGDASSLTGGSVLISTTQEADAGSDEIQLVSIVGEATGGTFTLTFDGETTGAVAYNASAATVLAALEALTTPVAGDFLVSGSAGGPWSVTFRQNYAKTDVPLMTGNGSSLTGAGTQTIGVSTTTDPTGPNWFSEPNNWQTVGSSTAAAPTTGDTVVFADSSISCLYGLDDLSSVVLGPVNIRASYTGSIGLPAYEGDYFEYRTRELTIKTPSLIVGDGDGSGSGFIRINLQATTCAIVVYKTGNPTTDEKSLCIRGTSTSNSLVVMRGSVGFGTTTFEDAGALASLKVGFVDSLDADADVEVGPGITTLTTLVQAGGNLSIEGDSSLTIGAITVNDGTLEVSGACAVTSIRALEGVVIYSSSGTLAAAYVASGAELYFDRDLRSRTVTDITLEAGAKVWDPYQTCTWSNGITLNDCSLAEVELNIGSNIGISLL